ncbi:MAG: hypothetical protein K5865_03905 [Eubacterium sp.]|nr:hypothetical protein [Eubacterium sp.]
MRKMMLTVATVIMTGMLSAGAIHAGSAKQKRKQKRKQLLGLRSTLLLMV